MDDIRSNEDIQPMFHSYADSKCNFCSTKKDVREIVFADLSTRYSSSQNYYYTRDINDIVSDKRTFANIKHKDFLTIDEEDEFLKRFYKYEEYPNKINVLTEYYKFHKDIPRLFMLPVTNSLNKYHDRKRRHDYNKITKMLNPSDKPKSILKGSIEERVLNDLTPSKLDSIVERPQSTLQTFLDIKGKLAEAIGNSKMMESEISESMANSKILNFMINEKPVILQEPHRIFKKKEVSTKKPFTSSIKMLNLEKLKVKKPLSTAKRSSAKSQKDSAKISLRKSNNASHNEKSASESRLKRNLASRKALEKKRSEGARLRSPVSTLQTKSALIIKEMKSSDKIDLESLRVQTDRFSKGNQEKKRDWRQLLISPSCNNEKLLKSDIAGNKKSLKEKISSEARILDSSAFKNKNKKKANLKVSKTDRFAQDFLKSPSDFSKKREKVKTSRDTAGSKHAYTKSEAMFLQVKEFKEHEKFLEDIRKAVLPFIKKAKARAREDATFNNNFFNFFLQGRDGLGQVSSVKHLKRTSKDFLLENFLKERKRLFN